MQSNLRRQIKTLRICVLVMILLNSYFILSSFKNGGFDRKEKFEEIDAERINIVAPNGKTVMALSNKRLIPGPAMNGKTYPKEYADGREMFSGIIFFNEEGDEVGGLLYNGIKKDSGYYAMEHFSFDQWKQNQVVAMQYIDNGKSRRAGLRVWDRPDLPLDQTFDRFVIKNRVPKNSTSYDSIQQEIRLASARGENGVERMFIGSQDEVAQIQLRDKKGKVRARFFVDNSGNAKIEFLDENGNVINSYPGKN